MALSQSDTKVSPLLAEVLTKYVKPDEGGYVERDSEPGGAGNFGLAFTNFAAWRRLQGMGHPTFADLRALSWDEAMQIYAYMFARPCHFDELPPGVNYTVLDSCINNGEGGETAFLREALGLPVQDAKGRKLRFTPDVLWGAKHRDPAALVNAFCDVRLKHQKGYRLYNALPTPKSKHTYGYVWDNRVTLVRGRALAMIQEKH